MTLRPHEALPPGEKIGQFKLVSVNAEEIALEWNGQQIRKSVDELWTAAVRRRPRRRRRPRTARLRLRHRRRRRPRDRATATRFGIKTCQPNDGTPDGTVVDGYRKTSGPTPFGSACLWEPVGR